LILKLKQFYKKNIMVVYQECGLGAAILAKATLMNVLVKEEK
jgi:hypothetical protein